MRRYIRDEHGDMRDERDFQPNLTNACMECDADLGHYAEIGTPEATCEECWKQVESVVEG